MVKQQQQQNYPVDENNDEIFQKCTTYGFRFQMPNNSVHY